MELLEDREALLELDPHDLAPLREKYEAKQRSTIEALANAFAHADFKLALQLTGALNYQSRMLETIREKQPVS